MPVLGKLAAIITMLKSADLEALAEIVSNNLSKDHDQRIML